MKASILYLLWYIPEPASYHPVGRLIRVPHEGHYLHEFAYLRAAAFVGQKYGFEPIAGGFPDPRARYLNAELFPFFSNRIMSPARLDYSAYLESLGLPTNPDDTLLVLSRGANKATDRFETFEYPRFNEVTHQLETFFWLRGIRHQPEGESRATSLAPGQSLSWAVDAQPNVDEHAVAIFRAPNEPRLGFLPNYLTREVEKLSAANAQPALYVERVNPTPMPVQQRVLCKLTAQWPSGYVPFDHDALKPIPSDAWDLSRLMDPKTRDLLQTTPA